MDEYNLLQEVFSDKDRPRPSKHSHPLPRLLRCVCDRSLVFEPKVKKYKNGESQDFWYLRCNRHKYHPSEVCPRSSINVKDLNKQILEKLGQVRISPKLIEWGIKRLNEKNFDKQKIREAEFTSIQESYNAVVKKLDNLLQLKLSPLNSNGSMLSDLEYAEERVSLLKDRDSLKDKLNSLDNKREDWAKLAVSVFNFAARAQETYEKGDWETRADICRIFGMSLVLNGKKLEVHARAPIIYMKEAINSSEPQKLPLTWEDTAISATGGTLGVEYRTRTGG